MSTLSLAASRATVHPTAIIEPGACLEADVSVGAYAYIGSQVQLGAGTVVHHHATVEGNTVMGERNEVYPYACIGGRSHDLKFKGGNPGVRIGHQNVFREYVTVHAATQDGDRTLLGDNNFLLAYSHIAHDCRVANHTIISSHAALGGHVVLEDRVNVGWSSGIHQYCQVGACAMIGACSKVVQDVAPFMIADGNPASVRTINRIGLERAGWSLEDIELARTGFKHFFKKGLGRSGAIKALEALPQAAHPVLQTLIEFARRSTRGWA